MKILVLNSGSSSLKFSLFDMNNQQSLTHGIMEGVSNQHEAINTMAVMLSNKGYLSQLSELGGIAHRVVHGGELFCDPILIDQQVINTIEKLIPLAPLHNPANLMAIKIFRQIAPEIPQIAVFDTSFHQTMPRYAYIYALPFSLYEKQKIRRYGFHGSSHHYVARQAEKYLKKKATQKTSELKLISLHLGNGASACAVNNGQSIDTSMGMTPLAGLVMGTRSGDIDPAISFYLAREMGMSIEQLDKLLNKDSGLKGICNESDMRTISVQAQNGDAHSHLAITIFCYQIKKYIGSYLAALNGADAIIFTGGIGENSSLVRELVCQNLQNLGIDIDPEKNSHQANSIMEIQTDSAAVKVLVIPTNEELEIAIQSTKIINRME